MSSVIESNGSCLCGAVGVQAKSMSTEVGACHCGTCRKWTGGPMMVVDCGTDVVLTGEEQITIFASSEWAERGFCSRCGTHLFYKLKQKGQYFIPVGVFDKEANIHFNHQVFVEEKPAYYSFANETKNMTGAELFAQYTDDSGD